MLLVESRGTASTPENGFYMFLCFVSCWYLGRLYVCCTSPFSLKWTQWWIPMFCCSPISVGSSPIFDSWASRLCWLVPQFDSAIFPYSPDCLTLYNVKPGWQSPSWLIKGGVPTSTVSYIFRWYTPQRNRFYSPVSWRKSRRSCSGCCSSTWIHPDWSHLYGWDTAYKPSTNLCFTDGLFSVNDISNFI